AVEKQKPTLPKEKTTSGNEQPQSVPEAKYQTGVKTLDEQLNAAPTSLLDLLDSLKNYILSLGDVSERALKYWISYRKLKNFASIWVISKSNEIVINLNLNPSDASCSGGFCRDVSNVGHWGSGDIEIRIKNHSDLQKAMPLIIKAYDRG
ncbi:MAG TPA: DUF5655 domain-containing protein, partial [Candidatus Melainabacteria bacterium]|nr:DUF5655 domain-containing protein [Candidatus Melainabacteria bacterium]